VRISWPLIWYAASTGPDQSLATVAAPLRFWRRKGVSNRQLRKASARTERMPDQDAKTPFCLGRVQFVPREKSAAPLTYGCTLGQLCQVRHSAWCRGPARSSDESPLRQLPKTKVGVSSECGRCASLVRVLLPPVAQREAWEMRGEEGAYRSLLSFCRQPTSSDVVHRRLVTADGPNAERHQWKTGQTDNRNKIRS